MFNPSFASVPLVPEGEIGKGYGAKELQYKHEQRVGAALGQMNPELKRRATAAYKALHEAESAAQGLRVELVRACGDYATDAIRMLRADAAKELQAELDSRNRAAHKVAQQLVTPSPSQKPVSQTPATKPESAKALVEQAEKQSKRRARKS